MAEHCSNLAFYVVFSSPLAGTLISFISEGLVISTFEHLVMWLACWTVAAATLAGIIKAWKSAYGKSQLFRSAMLRLNRNWWALFVPVGGILIAIDFLIEDTHAGELGAFLCFVAVINITGKVLEKIDNKIGLTRKITQWEITYRREKTFT